MKDLGIVMKCCICGKKIEGYGNNPWPVDTKEKSRCCSECNMRYVIPARLVKLVEKEKN